MNNKFTILLVDDSMTQAQQISTYLASYAIDVLIANSGRQALRLLDAYELNAVVMDLHMPDMDGFQLTRRLKRDQKTANIPLIMVTSSENPQHAVMSGMVGIEQYLTKDMNLAENLRFALLELGIV